MGDARRRVGAVTELHRLGHRRVEQVHGHRRGRRTRPGVGGQTPLHQLDQPYRLVRDHATPAAAAAAGSCGRRAGEAEPRQRAEA